MANFTNYKAIRVTGESRQVALESLIDYFHIKNGKVRGEATAAWTLFQKKHPDLDFETFAQGYLITKKAKPGDAYVITEIPAILNRRSKPFKTINIRNSRRCFDKAFQLIDRSSNKILDTLYTEIDEYNHKIIPTKNQAFARAKQIIKPSSKVVFTGQIDIKQVYTDGKIVGSVCYKPSKEAQPGTYLVFGFIK